MIRPDTDELIAFLDSLAKIDPVTMGKLISARVPCNEGLAKHPTVQCGDYHYQGKVVAVGMLGILNGYAGVFDHGPYKGWGPISAIVEADGRCTGFKRMLNNDD